MLYNSEKIVSPLIHLIVYVMDIVVYTQKWAIKDTTQLLIIKIWKIQLPIHHIQTGVVLSHSYSGDVIFPGNPTNSKLKAARYIIITI